MEGRRQTDDQEERKSRKRQREKFTKTTVSLDATRHDTQRLRTHVIDPKPRQKKQNNKYLNSHNSLTLTACGKRTSYPGKQNTRKEYSYTHGKVSSHIYQYKQNSPLSDAQNATAVSMIPSKHHKTTWSTP